MSCRCSHGRDAHAHYRAGTDCALCGCGRYRRRWVGQPFTTATATTDWLSTGLNVNPDVTVPVPPG